MKKFNLKIIVLVLVTCTAVIFMTTKMLQKLEAREIFGFNREAKNYNVELKITDENNQKIANFMVAIADEKNKKLYGLMNLDELPQNYGMLFPFAKSDIITMWMKNTRISLDMIFIDENNIISHIATNTKPYSLEIISSEVPAKQVLEINAGLVKKFGIKIGQKIE